MENKKKILGWIAILFSLLLAIGGFFYLRNPLPQEEKTTKNKVSTPIKIRFGNVNGVSVSLASIADKKGYFKEEGLDLEMTTYEVGKLAVDDLLLGKQDFCISAQTPLIHTGFKESNLKIIAVLSSCNDTFKIIARKDKNILQKSDLKGKIINASKGTAMAYFVDVLLDKNGINKKDVHITDYPVSKALELLKSGQIDALSTYDTMASTILKELGDNGIIFSEKNLYTSFIPISVREDFSKKNPESVEKMLRALKKSADFIYSNHDEARNIIAEFTQLTTDEVESYMSNVDYGLSLKQSLLILMNSEAQWMIDNGITKEKEIPDFFKLISDEPMKKLFPDAVSLSK